MKFTDLFIKRPVLATVINLFILLLGINAFDQLSIRQYPKIEEAVVTVSTVYVGASTDLVQGFITTPVQQAIAGAEGIDYITSSSVNSNSTVTAHINPEYDSDQVLTEIMAKVAEVRGELPKESEDSVIKKGTSRGSALMYIRANSDTMTDEQVTDYLTRVVVPKLATLEGVASAEIFGARKFAMRLWLDPLKMAAHDITADELNAAIRRNHFLSTAGQTKGEWIATQVKAYTDLSTVEGFENIVVIQEGDVLVKVKDVAKVELSAENFDSGVFFNGNPAVFIGVSATPTANPLEVSQRVKTSLDKLQSELPAGTEVEVIYDSTKFIRASINEVAKTLLEASLIVILVVFLFLGEIRTVIIPVVAIPLSLVGTIFLMWTLGYSVNLLTLLALVLAIGLVVDDAIVVVENIHRHIEEGLSPVQAAIQGAREIATPVISMTLTLAAVYAPIGFLTGITGTLFSEFAFSLAGAVIISGVVALTLSPMMCSKLMHGGKEESALAKKLDVMFGRLKNTYQGVLRNTLNYRPVVVVFALLVLVSIPFLMMFTRSELAPQEDQGSLFLASKAPNYANINYLNRHTENFDTIFKKLSEFEVSVRVNRSGTQNSSFSVLGLTPWDERQRTAMEIQPLVQAEVDKIPGIDVFIFARESLPGAGGGAPIQFVINTTSDYPSLAQLADQMALEARKSGLFMFIDSDLKFSKPEVRISIDRDKAAQMGISMEAIGSALSTLLGEGWLNRFSVEGRSYKVIPQATADARRDPSWLNHYYVRTVSGEQVTLGTVISMKTIAQPVSLNQFQQLNSVKLEGMMVPGVSLGEALQFLERKAQEILPEGFSVDYDGQSRQFVTEGSKLYLTFALSLIAIFLVLAAQFESFRDPLVILISVPLSICGALIPITLGFATMNIYSQIGLITLIGLISKHGILIVEFANQLQTEGMSRLDAISEAASVRLRPVLMTTAAMVLGVVPLILASGAGAVSRHNIGLVIATGMTVGTLFTLFVVPVVYSYVAKDHQQTPAAAALSH
ncbi:MAG: multidrug efflux RND transporter permease subunit [Pseudomonadales bacterium]|nr:multidrug efflux RND transporter permease subunit [Pseudomonadales bacterium]